MNENIKNIAEIISNKELDYIGVDYSPLPK